MKSILLTILATSLLFPLSAQQTKQADAEFLDSVKKMEAELRQLLSNEKKERKAEVDSLRNELSAIRKERESAAHATAKKLNAEIQKEERSRKNMEYVERLKAGNQRFVTGKLSKKELGKERVELAKGQHPYAVVVTCSDSRVPPELLFDESLGKLFVVRVAGNVVDSVALGSIEYAAEHLHAPLIVVLGHTECGAVKATVAGGEVPPNIGSIVWRLKEAVNRARANGVQPDQLANSVVAENVALQIFRSETESAVLEELVEKGEVSIVGAVYDIASGKVFFTEESNSAHSPAPAKH